MLYIYQETCKLLVWLVTVAGSDFQLQSINAKAQSFNLSKKISQSLRGMEKNRISEINIELPFTSLTLFSSLLKFIGSAAIWATCFINFNVIFFRLMFLEKTKQNGKY